MLPLLGRASHCKGDILKIIGITGTQKGASAAQLEILKAVLWSHSPYELHHGDCVGVDEQAHNLATGRVLIHPPTNPGKRAWCLPRKGEILPEYDYLDRNHHIVQACELLIALPDGPERMRSGTWATIRYATKTGRPVLIIYPTGNVEMRN
jgi:hypothetical protein